MIQRSGEENLIDGIPLLKLRSLGRPYAKKRAIG
jgi:hypothetical protein